MGASRVRWPANDQGSQFDLFRCLRVAHTSAVCAATLHNAAGCLLRRMLCRKVGGRVSRAEGSRAFPSFPPALLTKTLHFEIWSVVGDFGAIRQVSPQPAHTASQRAAPDERRIQAQPHIHSPCNPLNNWRNNTVRGVQGCQALKDTQPKAARAFTQ